MKTKLKPIKRCGESRMQKKMLKKVVQTFSEDDNYSRLCAGKKIRKNLIN